MDIDEDKIDDAVLALLWLTLHDGRRAWKGFDWNATDRLFKKGLIGDPASKTKSLILTDEGLQRSEALFREHQLHLRYQPRGSFRLLTTQLPLQLFDMDLLTKNDRLIIGFLGLGDGKIG
ncbi:hypothetical protein ILFOPFJJ_06465 [Ensifer psoraleae]|nr:hypothetical protein [Sinorhizobium psoraleae]